MRTRALFLYLVKDLLYDGNRSMLTVISLAAVIVSTLAAMGLSDVFLEFGSTPQTGSRNLLIISDYALDPMQSKVEYATLEEAVRIVHRQFGQNSILDSFPAIYRTLEVNNRTLRVIAVPARNLVGSYSLVLQEGNWPETLNEVVVSPEALAINEWNAGETIQLRGEELVISGCVLDKAAKTSAIWMTYETGEWLFDTKGEFQIGVVQIAPEIDLTRVQTSLENDPQFPAGYAVFLNQQMYGRYGELVHDLLKLSTLLAGLSAIMVVFGAFNASSLTILERKGDLAILETVGFGQRKTAVFILSRTLLQTLAAFILALGVMVLVIWNSQRDPFVSHGKTLVLDLSAGTILICGLLTLVSAGLGSWLSAASHGGSNLAERLRE